MSATVRRRPAAETPRAGAAEPVGHDLAAELLAWVVDHADVLALVPAGLSRKLARPGQGGPMHWLLLPVPERILQRLELVDADREDLEDGGDAEPDCDVEVTYPNNLDQSYLALATKQGDVDDDHEPDGTDEEDGSEEDWFQPAIMDRLDPLLPVFEVPEEPAARVQVKPHVHPVLGTFVPL